MYCPLQGLIDRFGETELLKLTDMNRTGLIDTVRVERTLDDAGQEINTYLAARYDTPIDPAPDILARLCADIARYRLYENRVTEDVRNRYRDAVAMLRDLASGKATLPSATDEPAAPVAGMDVTVTRSRTDRVFTMSTFDSAAPLPVANSESATSTGLTSPRLEGSDLVFTDQNGGQVRVDLSTLDSYLSHADYDGSSLTLTMSDGQIYSIGMVHSHDQYIDEAPADGKQYTRENGAWTEVELRADEEITINGGYF